MGIESRLQKLENVVLQKDMLAQADADLDRLAQEMSGEDPFEYAMRISSMSAEHQTVAANRYFAAVRKISAARTAATRNS